MIMMQGNDRIFDKVITEGGTAAARTISLYGVKELSELQGASLIVRANMGGSSSATTMKINNLAATKLSVFKNGGIVDADADWISSGQLYMLYYDGIQFIAFPMSASSGSSNNSVEFADFPIDVLNLNAQSSESNISSAFGGAAKTAEFDALVQAGTKIIRFTNVDSFVYYTAIYYKHVNVENSTINDIVVVLHNYTDKTDLEMFTFLGTMTEDGDFEKYTAVVKDTLYSSSQEGTLNNPRAFAGDADTKTTPGVYAITPFSNIPSNIPSGVSYGTMIVTTDENASTITQTLQTSNTVYFRCKYSTNDWGEWVDLGASGGGSSYNSKIYTLPIAVYNLDNDSTEEEITAAFGGADKVNEFHNAVNSTEPYIFVLMSSYDCFVATQSNHSSESDCLYFASVHIGVPEIIKLTFHISGVGPMSTSNDNLVTYDSFSRNDIHVDTMKGATSTEYGSEGLVPMPFGGDQNKFLRGDGTWAVPTNTTYSVATTSTNGLMSSAMVTKLNGIATGATTNTASTTTPKANGTAAVGTESRFARGDHVHPAQTTITGNAGSATKLQTARTINGVSFDGSSNINTFDSSYKIPGCYRMKIDSNPEINLPGGNNFIPLENFPMYSELGTNPLFTLNSDGTITINKTCMLDFRGTWSVYGSGNTSNKIYSNITYYDNDIQAWMPLYSSPYVQTSTMEMTSYYADFGPGQMGIVLAGTKIRASLDSTNDTSGAVFSGQISGYSLFINVIYVKG